MKRIVWRCIVTCVCSWWPGSISARETNRFHVKWLTTKSKQIFAASLSQSLAIKKIQRRILCEEIQRPHTINKQWANTTVMRIESFEVLFELTFQQVLESSLKEDWLSSISSQIWISIFKVFGLIGEIDFLVTCIPRNNNNFCLLFKMQKYSVNFSNTLKKLALVTLEQFFFCKKFHS